MVSGHAEGQNCSWEKCSLDSDLLQAIVGSHSHRLVCLSAINSGALGGLDPAHEKTSSPLRALKLKEHCIADRNELGWPRLARERMAQWSALPLALKSARRDRATSSTDFTANGSI
jgi:hypothetical protein